MKSRAVLVFLSAVAASVAVAAVAAEAPSGEEFAASFEVRPDAIVDGAPIGFGFSLKSVLSRYVEGSLDFKMPAGPVLMGPKDLLSGCDAAFRTGLWHHVAVAYRQKGNTAHVWVDGELVGVGHTETANPPSAQVFLDAPRAKDDFPGEVRNVRTWKNIPSEEELLPKAVLDPIRKANLAFEARQIPGYDGREPASGLLPVGIDRHARGKHMPFQTPPDATVLKELRVAAAQGEIEDASFMVLPFRDFADVDVRVSDLKGPEGMVPASCFDVRLVKCWLQSRYGWSNFYTAGLDCPTLTPELLVHDDRLVTVDPKTHQNVLRISYPDGDAFVPVSRMEDPKTCEGFNFNLEPVRDAEKLLPFALRAGHSRQLWLTLRCPEDARGGDYRGTVTVLAGGKTLCEVPLLLKVHPFRLPLAHCHYAPELPFLTTWMWHGNLPDKLKGYGGPGGSLEKAQRRFYAELRNMAEHNCGYPWALLPPPSATSTLDLASMQLEYMKLAGCEMRPLFGGVGAGGDLAYRASTDPKALDMSIPESRKAFEAEMAHYTNLLERQAAFVESRVGHREVVGCAFDEAKADYIRRSFPSFAALNHFGGLSFTTSGDEQSAAFMTDLNDMADGFDLVNRVPKFNRRRIRRWHAGGARVVTYASPHSGPECPDIWRRGRGLGGYFADTDGINEYMWYESQHIWNEFLYGAAYRGFCMVYPTADGVLDTVQWEALREGIDDIRYFSYLNRLAKVAQGAKEASLVAEARRIVQWMELADWEGGNLDALRFGAAERIVTLTAALERAGLGKQLVLDYPAKAQPFRPILPEPPAKASAKELRTKAKALVEAGACDLAVKFYSAAAACETDRDQQLDDWAAAGDAALAYRDRAMAFACYEKAESPVKKALLTLWPDRIGWQPSAKDLARAEQVIWNQGKGADKVRLLQAMSAAGLDDRVLKLSTQMHDSMRNSKTPGAGEMRTQSARLAAAIYEKRGEMNKAANWYESASADEWPPCSTMMYNAAECARKAGNYTKAIDCYSKVMGQYGKKGDNAWRYEQMRKRVEEISKILRSKTKSPQGMGLEGESETEGLSLDEE